MFVDPDVEKASSLRTVIVIDHGPTIASLPSTRIDTEATTSKHHRSSSAHSSIIGSLGKSVWTTLAEGAVEYCRIVYDLLPEEYMVQVIVTDANYKKLNSFRREEQNISQVLKGLASAGPPKEDASDDGEYDPQFFEYPGLEIATSSILESFAANMNNSDDVGSHKHGRIVFLTNLESGKDTRPLVARVAEIQERLDTERECQIDLVIVNVSTSTDKITKEKKEISSTLNATTMTFRTVQLPSKMIMLAKRHFNLRSTSITGIPMKEEQHAGTSANYDVEIVHPAEVHHETYWFCSNSDGQTSGAPGHSSRRDTFASRTITLKWCTPKSSSNNELLQCIGAYRCTPAEVNSRPAACLISFLQQGRTVLLEQPKRSGAKVISHMLVSHGGDVYIHVLATGRNPVEDPPSISEGCGGRVTDYRIGDFGRFMKENRLAPSTFVESSSDETPIEKDQRTLSKEARAHWMARTCLGFGAKSIILKEIHLPNSSTEDSVFMKLLRELVHTVALSRLERGTRHWPMAISETLVFNMSSQLDTLLSNLVKANLSEEEVQECKKVIYKLQAMESKNDTLPLPMISMRGKGSKREEQYRQLWAELDIFINEASRTSPNHAKVLDCLRGLQEGQTSSQANNDSSNASAASSKDSKSSDQHSAQDLAWKELDRYSQMTEHEKKLLNQVPSDPRKRRNTEQLEEITLPKKKSGTQQTMKPNAMSIASSFSPKGSLLSIWTSQLKSVADRRHEEFEGRKNSVDGKAELYQELNKESSLASLNTSSLKEWGV